MAFVLFLVGLAGFALWLFRQSSDTQLTSIATLCGGMFLYSSFVPSFLGVPHPYGLTLTFFLAIFTSVGLEKLKQAR